MLNQPAMLLTSCTVSDQYHHAKDISAKKILYDHILLSEAIGLRASVYSIFHVAEVSTYCTQVPSQIQNF